MGFAHDRQASRSDKEKGGSREGSRPFSFPRKNGGMQPKHAADSAGPGPTIVIASVAQQPGAGSGRPGLLRYARNDELADATIQLAVSLHTYRTTPAA
jgi:hypothetical protein